MVIRTRTACITWHEGFDAILNRTEVPYQPEADPEDEDEAEVQASRGHD
jgi:hypothetical protein